MSPKINLLFLLAICLSVAYPVSTLSRWFSASYADMSSTLKRYSHCHDYLEPLKNVEMNETEFLVNQMRLFLNEANYQNEQLLNISALMDNLCRPEPDADYPISLNIDVNMYNHSISGKENRCNAIDQALDSMFVVFRRAAVNKSEPLDFSVIQYYPNSNNNESYNLTDLINTVWIKSDTQIEHVCKITNSLKDYVTTRIGNSTTQARIEKPTSAFESLMDLIDRLFLEPLLGLQKRLYWEGNNRIESVYSAMSNQFGNARRGIGSGYNGTRNYLTNMFTSPSPANKTTPLIINSTTAI